MSAPAAEPLRAERSSGVRHPGPHGSKVSADSTAQPESTDWWVCGGGRVHEKGLLICDDCDVKSHIRLKNRRHFLCLHHRAVQFDRFATTVDHEGLVANAGLILAGTLMARLGVSALIERWVRTGSANPGPKICTVVAAMLAGATHIDHVGMLRAGRTGRVLGFTPMAPSTVGTFPADVHVRSRPPARSGAVAHAGACLGAGRRPRQGAARGRCGLHDLRGPRQTETGRRVRLHQKGSAITRCSPHAPTPARCSPHACAKAPRGPREAWCASPTSSSPACDAPGLPGRPRCAATRGSGHGS